MARFLLDSDYKSIIQEVDLLQIIESDYNNLYAAEEKAIARMRTKLVQRYMVDIELGSMTAYNAATHYRTKDRVLATGNVIYSVKLFDRWENTKAYIVGNIVTDDNGYVYTCATANTNEKLANNTTYWTPMVNIINTNTTYWAQIDNRYPLFVELAMDMALYNVHARINPRNIPDLRIERNREALDQLERWASGTDTAEVLNINTTDQTGYSIRWGASLDKQDNFFK